MMSCIVGTLDIVMPGMSCKKKQFSFQFRKLKEASTLFQRYLEIWTEVAGRSVARYKLSRTRSSQ
jgi:hypothetical protein